MVSHHPASCNWTHELANLKGSSCDIQPKVKEMEDSLSMISSSTRLAQLGCNHPDVGGEWPNAWALLKHYHFPFASLCMLFLCLCVFPFRTPLSLTGGRSWTCHWQCISICMSFAFACRCCHSAATSASFSKMPTADSIEGHCRAELRDFVLILQRVTEIWHYQYRKWDHWCSGWEGF